MRYSLRIFDPAFARRALGFGPQAPLAAKIWRAMRIAYWFTPFVGRTLRQLDRLSPIRPLPRDPYPPVDPYEDIVEEEGSAHDDVRNLGLSYSLVRPATPRAPMPIIISPSPVRQRTRRSG